MAFYPNIPVDLCIEKVYKLFFEYYYPEGLPNPNDIKENAKINLFQQCLEIGNTELIYIYMKEYYQQLHGLAMDVASSPDLANLFGWFFERALNILSLSQIPFYGRYIDDCLALVYASTEVEAVNASGKSLCLYMFAMCSPVCIALLEELYIYSHL